MMMEGTISKGADFADNATTPDFLNHRDLRLILFGGKGGVGKTTCAVATALTLAASAPEARFLLVSTDPAHSLADSLDGLVLPANLSSIEFDAKAHLQQFKQDNQTIFREMAKRGTFLDDDDITRFLDLSLPGLDELMAFIEIARWVEDGEYQTLIVDTAPTGHTLRLLHMPELALNWLAALDTLMAKHRYMKKVFSGRYQSDAIDAFLLDLTEKVRKFSALLQDVRRCRFVPVTHADALSFYETSMLLKELSRLDMIVDELILNQLVPLEDCAICRHRRHRQITALNHAAGHLGSSKLWAIAYLPEEIRGAKHLTSLWQKAYPVDSDKPLTSELSKPDADIDVHPSAAVPLPTAGLLIFAGKGGVGKTTLACATALDMARRRPNQKILLFSIDPAHSLSACLDMPVENQPTPIEANLSAIECDATADFEDLKIAYQEELKHFLEKLAPNFDFTFDRQVMERIMDLSPTGIDEVMAVTRIIDLLKQKTYDTIILDSAPSGHLIRLLETPELIRQWLRVFFDLFIKYKRIFRLPDIAARMVEISKGIKSLQEMLKASKKAMVYAVSILTQMSLAETEDLVSACDAMGADVPALFLNQATPESDCGMCMAVHRREARVRQQFEEELPHLLKAMVYYQPETTGRTALKLMGKRLYTGL